MKRVALLEWRMFDQYAHRTVEVTIEGSAVDSQGISYLYVRRMLAPTWPEAYTPVIPAMLQRRRNSPWTEVEATLAFVEGMAKVRPGERLRAGRRIIEGVDPQKLVPDGHIVLNEPASGWRWRRSELTPTELSTLERNTPAL